MVESRIAVVLETFRDHGDAWIVAKLSMKLRAFCVLHAVNGPCAAKSHEVFCRCWMPVAALVDGRAALEKLVDEFVERSDDFVAVRDGKSATGAEVVLDVDYD